MKCDLIRILLRLRLRRIERALGIRLQQDQLDLVLDNKTDIIFGERRNGKTTAIIIKILLIRVAPIITFKDCEDAMLLDPDFCKNKRWHMKELYRCWQICTYHNIKMFYMNTHTFGKRNFQ